MLKCAVNFRAEGYGKVLCTELIEARLLLVRFVKISVNNVAISKCGKKHIINIRNK